MSQLSLYRTEPTTEKWKTEKLKSKKNGYGQKYQYTVRGIRGVSHEEGKEGYGGKN